MSKVGEAIADENEWINRIALTMVDGIGPHLAKNLLSNFGSASEIFSQKRHILKKIQGIGHLTASNISAFKNFDLAEQEFKLLYKHDITPLFYMDRDYPRRLKQAEDAPVLIYQKGKANLNSKRVIAVVGTRKATPYGKQFTDDLISSLKPFDVVVISGLAAGTDTNVHKACLKNDMVTLGVLGHGFGTIYPQANKHLAAEMISNGALITEYTYNTPGNRENFPQRNRIVAAMCDALIVIESGEKGGSLITADLANQYNRDVYALPGKITDTWSKGCNRIIADNQAAIIDNVPNLLKFLGYDSGIKKVEKQQLDIFAGLNLEEKIIVDLLQNKSLGIDELKFDSGI
ncbi:MAG TPA: DNA-processing protein DprA, partial [Bacteroidia bacterium]